ncbi:Holliday junction branch migration protein RuvA [Candidatus Peregrinibacteria bacterium]|nr:Holliday junction branch migration protein RuvA [Candidatus Peregrinibacteria bacterium]
MIGYLSGLIIDKDEKHLLVLAQSVGYKVAATTDLLAMAQIDHKIQLFIHTTVREDDISLYGFAKKEELKFFEQLIGVSGVGPKTALEILSTPLHLTQHAIVAEDAAFLSKIKGLGKKTAERLVLELKNKVSPAYTKSGKRAPAVNEEAIQALESLGYARFEVVKAMAELPREIKETEEIVKYFLKTGI